MNKEVQEIVDLANRICGRLEDMANQDRAFCCDVQLSMDRMRYDLEKSTYELQTTVEALG